MVEYISREAAIAAIKSIPSGNWSSERYINEIKSIPVADVRPAVHGKWIYDCERTMGDGWTYKQRHCSEYGYQTVECDNFCQHCGAIMDA